MLLTVVALVLFTRDKIPLETSSMVVLACSRSASSCFPTKRNGRSLHAMEFFHGFGHEALVAVCALMIVGQGLVRTGALEPLGRVLASLWRAGPAAGDAVHADGGRGAQRLRQQHADRGAAAAGAGQRVAAHRQFAVAGADADGLRHADRRRGHHHRHLDQPAGGVGGGGHGPAAAGHLRFRRPGSDGRCARHPVPVLRRAAPAARSAARR